MKLLIKNREVEFDELPPLDYVHSQSMQEYWIISGSLIQRRQFKCGNIAHDLYAALDSDLFKDAKDIQIHIKPHDQSYLDLEPVCNRVRFNSRGSASICHYNAINKKLISIYPSYDECVKALHLKRQTIMACARGVQATIDRYIITSVGYLTEEDFQIRREASNRFGTPTPTYLYDYTGDFVGKFMTLIEAARYVGVHKQTLLQGIIKPNTLIHGFYVYFDPNKRPPVCVDKSVKPIQ